MHACMQVWSNCDQYNAPGSQIAMAGKATAAALAEEWLARQLPMDIPGAQAPQETQKLNETRAPFKLKIKLKKHAEAAVAAAAAVGDAATAQSDAQPNAVAAADGQQRERRTKRKLASDANGSVAGMEDAHDLARTGKRKRQKLHIGEHNAAMPAGAYLWAAAGLPACYLLRARSHSAKPPVQSSMLI